MKPIYFGMLAALIVLGLVTYAYLSPPKKSKLEEIAQACAMGGTTNVGASFNAGMEVLQAKIEAGAKMTRSEVGAVVETISADQHGTDKYQIYKACLDDQMIAHLFSIGIIKDDPSGVEKKKIMKY